MKLVEAINDCISGNRRFFGVEFFPPKSEAAVSNLYDRMQRLTGHFAPLFCAMTSDSSTAEDSMEMAATAQQVMNLNMQVIITGGDATEEKVRERLQSLKARGIQNVMLVRGGSANPPFEHAVDLVKFVRREFGAHFGIAVAGYPEGHQGEGATDEEIQFLKDKVDAGADLIITQMIFDAQVFLDFCRKCRNAGVTCPIIPGVMPIHSYVQFTRRLRGFKGTDKLGELLRPVKNDDAEVQSVAATFMIQMVKQLLRGGVRGIYVFSLNLETPVARLIEGSALAGRVTPAASSSSRAGTATAASTKLPAHWRRQRSEEEVRPIFWAGRTNSYLARTAQWDEFPNGRWGSSQSPAFRNDTTYHTQIAVGSHARQCNKFRQVTSIADLCTSFLAFLEGSGKLPWAEDELSSEAGILMEDVLKPLNARGLFTINSQPAVNGASSTNKIVGWGPPGGYVYQKQYLEFFVSPTALPTVIEVFAKHPSLSYVGLSEDRTNVVSSADATLPLGKDGEKTKDVVTALTWGVFPGHEIQQPTIVSTSAFLAWTEEAFSLWEAPFERGVAVPPVISEIRKSWVLVNVVDNDYIRRPTALSVAVADICSRIPAQVATSPVVSQPHTPSVGSSPSTPVGGGTLLPRVSGGNQLPKLLSSCSLNDLAEVGVHMGGAATSASPSVLNPLGSSPTVQ